MKIACASYPIEWHQDWASYEAKISRWVREAAGTDAGFFRKTARWSWPRMVVSKWSLIWRPPAFCGGSETARG